MSIGKYLRIMVKRTIAGLFFLGFVCVSHAQPMLMTIEQLFELADKNSKDIQLHNLMINEADQAVKVAKNKLLPTIDAKAEFSYIGDGVMTDRDFSNGIHADMPHFGNSFVLKASQVVYSGGAISGNIERSKLEAVKARHEYDISRQNLRFLLLGYYLDLFQLNNQKIVYERNVEQTQILVKDMRVAYDQGTALKSDITRYELQLQNLQLGLTATKNKINVINYKLATTLGLDSDAVILPDTTALFNMTVERKMENDWMEESKFTPQMELANTEIEICRNNERLVRADKLPKVSISVTNDFNGPILVEVQPLDNNFNYWFAGVSLSYSFDALFKTGKKMKQAKLATLQSQTRCELTEEHISNAIHEAFVNLNEAYVRLETQQKSVQLAHENYGIVRQRYINGLALITDMLDASTTQLDMELQLANYQIGILYQYYLLKKITGTL